MKVVIILVILAAIAAIAFFILKSKKPTSTPTLSPPQKPPAPPVGRPATKTHIPVAKAPVAPVPAPTPVVAPAPAPAPVAEVKPAPSVDPLEEAEAYLAMERYPQAVGVLSKASQAAPDRPDLQLKLLEIYAHQNDLEAFDEQFDRFKNLATDAELQKVERLRESIYIPVVEPKSDSIDFTPSALPVAPESPAPEQVAPVTSEPDHSLDFSFDKPISDGQSPSLELDQSDDRAFRLDTPPETSSLDELEKEFRTSGIHTALNLDAAEKAPSATSLNLDMSHEELLPSLDAKVDPVPVQDNAPLLDDIDLDFGGSKDHDLSLPPLTPAALTTPAAAPAPAKEEVVDLGFDMDDSFDLEDDKSAPKPAADSHNLAEGFSDLDFSLPETGVAAPSLDSSELTSTADSAVNDMASRFDNLLEPGAGGSDSLLSRLSTEFSFIGETSEQSTNLSLAKSYIDLGELASARELLEEVIAQGSPEEQAEATNLMKMAAS